jgi:hypothetical protein
MDEKKCIFFGVDEPHWYDQGARLSLQFNEFMSLCRQHQIFNTDFYVPCFGDMFRDDFEIMNQNCFGWSFIPYHVDIPFYTSDAVMLAKDIHNDDLKMEEIRYRFLYMNNTHRMHRQLFSKFLIKKNMLSENCVAINVNDQQKFLITKQSWSKWLQTAKKENEKYCISTKQNDDWYMNATLLNLWKETELSQHQNPEIHPQTRQQLQYNFTEKAGFYIVNETVFHHPYPYFTEKTVSAFLSGRPFIVIGPSGSLRTLKSKGYKTFDNVIDESYDQITDPSNRLEAIFKIVEDLNHRPLDQIKKNVFESKDRVMHNKALTLDRLKTYSETVDLQEK